ncbi:carbohydrate ABC transporter permease [Paenibacillus sp. FSL H7-0942]|nr:MULTISPECIES: carbohydrate ABC transporter permease [Paenibacillus]MBY0117434.1 carbohydrate ABC transporter permease [Paenibacillus xylanexedens]OMF06608.1 ABC transporter permease [Paenibacillus amylolyticus]OMF62661.1 ABC transporter permease [Paenibacillus sp. FSL R5-0765]WFA85720.1 carbohydrate ABC transporter permease [Paenibacillus amylolyticus]
MRLRKRLASIGLNVLAWLLSLVVLIPFVVIVLNSFKSDAEAKVLKLTLPEKFIFENYKIVYEQGHLGGSFFNSLLHSGASSLLLVFVVAFSAFTLSRNHSRLSKFLYFFLILGITLPLNYIPLMEVMKSMGMINSHVGMILLYTAMGIPISLFITYAFVSNIPKELDEAAIMDGCNGIKLFLRIIVPLLTSVLVTVFVLNFLSVWNEFTAPLYMLNTVEMWPMTLAVYNFFGQFSAQWNLVSADIVLTSLPVLIVFLIGQKYIVGGLTSGAVKG